MTPRQARRQERSARNKARKQARMLKPEHFTFEGTVSGDTIQLWQCAKVGSYGGRCEARRDRWADGYPWVLYHYVRNMRHGAWQGGMMPMPKYVQEFMRPLIQAVALGME